jgi:uncharacterized protein
MQGEWAADKIIDGVDKKAVALLCTAQSMCECNEMTIKRYLIALIVLLVIILVFTVGRSALERRLLFFPTHGSHHDGLTPWVRDGGIIGYSRKVESPRNIWLMLHGNAGQASDRAYAIPVFSFEDSIYILEYPGYGSRNGVPSKETFNLAARQAYLLLRETYPKIPVCVVGESIGTGPASSLATLGQPPDKVVLIVPFDKLSRVAKDHYPSFPVKLLLRDDWDNVEALSKYKGPVEIFGAEADTIIPVRHAKALASALPSSRLHIIDGGHNDWSYNDRVRIRNP